MKRKEKEELFLIYQESLSMEEGRSFEDFLVSIIVGYKKALEILSKENCDCFYCAGEKTEEMKK